MGGANIPLCIFGGQENNLPSLVSSSCVDGDQHRPSSSVVRAALSDSSRLPQEFHLEIKGIRIISMLPLRIGAQKADM